MKAFWRKVTTKQAKTVVSLKTGCSEGTRGSSIKPWGEYSRQQRYIKKKALGKTVQAALSVIDIGCYKPVAVQFENMETNKKETFDITDGTFSEPVAKESTTMDDKINFALYIKDKFLLSDEAYHELSILTNDIPRLYELKIALNSSFSITSAPEGVIGVQQSLQSRLMA